MDIFTIYRLGCSISLTKLDLTIENVIGSSIPWLQIKCSLIMHDQMIQFQTGPNFKTGTNVKEKFPENPDSVEFPKSELLNRKFQKFREESQMEWKFPVRNFGIPRKVVHFSTNS